MPVLIGYHQEEGKTQVVKCSHCGQWIHLTGSSYKKDGEGFYHLEKNRRCWEGHLREKVQPST